MDRELTSELLSRGLPIIGLLGGIAVLALIGRSILKSRLFSEDKSVGSFELGRLADMRDKGLITDQEYDKLKKSVIREMALPKREQDIKRKMRLLNFYTFKRLNV